MTGILVTFFGIVILVNFIMARAAVSTFGGTVVDNSYVASQKFNGWLADDRRQRMLGWVVTTTLAPDRHIEIGVETSGDGPTPSRLVATLRHPLGRSPERRLEFVSAGHDRLRSTLPVPEGRWIVHFSLRSGQQRYAWIEEFR